ncbi:glycosyltransferase, partial [bacterium AH-315-J21]|nr:glycosyltransferase [bacterium AH-315-J21]
MVKKRQGKRKTVARRKSVPSTGSSTNPVVKAEFLRPPIFESQSAKDLYGRLQTESLNQLAQWQDGTAEDEFASLHTCEASLLTALLCHKLGLWQEVCRASETFLSEIDELLVEERSSVRKEQCRRNAGFLIEIVGQSYVHLENYHQAAICFETAIELNPSMQSGYLHWAELAQQLGMRNLAERIVIAGLKQIPSSPELRMYQQAVTSRQTVSVCMIVKNEEEFLEGCLLSIRDIADEIILVDTGSDDRTVEIAESFGCKIYHQPWEGDFSKHRNYSIEQASSDWIFIIDADERLVEKDIPQLKQYLQKSEYDLLSLTVYNVAERSGGDTTVLPSVRIFRQDLQLRYEGIVHNRLNFSDSMKELRCPVGLLHHGYDLTPEKMKLKHERSLALLHKQIEQDEKNAFAHFNLAQLIRARGNLGSESDCQDVLLHATRVIELTDPKSLEFGSIHLMAYHQQATALHELGKYEQAAEACTSALKIDNSYLDCVITLAHAFRSQQLYTKAAKWYTKYLELQKNYSAHQQTNTLIIIHLNSRANAYYNLGLIAEAQSNFAL